MWWRNFLARIAEALRSQADRDYTDRKRILTIAETYPLPLHYKDVHDIWPLVCYGLDHQGYFHDNLKTLLSALERRDDSHGWDEFHINFETLDTNRVEISFSKQRGQCDVRQLISVLHDLQQRIGNNHVQTDQ